MAETHLIINDLVVRRKSFLFIKQVKAINYKLEFVSIEVASPEPNFSILEISSVSHVAGVDSGYFRAGWQCNFM